MSHLAYNMNIGQPMANRKCCIEIIFSEEGGWPYDILHLADRPTVLIYDDSLAVFDPVTA